MRRALQLCLRPIICPIYYTCLRLRAWFYRTRVGQVHLRLCFIFRTLITSVPLLIFRRRLGRDLQTHYHALILALPLGFLSCLLFNIAWEPRYSSLFRLAIESLTASVVITVLALLRMISLFRSRKSPPIPDFSRGESRLRLLRKTLSNDQARREVEPAVLAVVGYVLMLFFHSFTGMYLFFAGCALISLEWAQNDDGTLDTSFDHPLTFTKSTTKRLGRAI